MSTPQVILENAAYHSQLLLSIAELAYIPDAVSQQTSYIGDLEAKLQENEAKLQKLSKTAGNEGNEHEVLPDSITRRLVHIMTGKKEKESGERDHAFEQEILQKHNQNSINELLVEARKVNAELLEKSTQLDSLKKELANLYSQIFDDPNQDFPRDTQLKDQLRSSYSLYKQIRKSLNGELQAAAILSKADKTMESCQAKMYEALGRSQWDIWGGGGMSNMIEHSALSEALSLSTEVEMLCEQAQYVSPFVQPVGNLTIAEGYLMDDADLDSIFTDTAFHDKVISSIADLVRAHSHLKAEKDAANRRADGARTQLIEALQSLRDSQKALDTYRRETFQHIIPGPPGLGYTPIIRQPVQDPPSPRFSSENPGNKNPYTAAETQASPDPIKGE